MLSKSSTTQEIRQAKARKIEQLVENNQLDLATKQLMDFIADFGTSEVTKRDATHIRRRFNKLREDKRRFPERDVSERETQLVDSILDLIKSIIESRELPDLPATIINNHNQSIIEENNQNSSEPTNLQETERDNEAHNDNNIDTNTANYDKKTPYEEDKESFKNKIKNHYLPIPSSSNTVFSERNITKKYKSKSADFT